MLGGLNTYSYARSSPIKFSDPTGEIVPAVAAIAVGIGSFSGALAGAYGAYLQGGSTTQMLTAAGIGAAGGAAVTIGIIGAGLGLAPSVAIAAVGGGVVNAIAQTVTNPNAPLNKCGVIGAGIGSGVGFFSTALFLGAGLPGGAVGVYGYLQGGVSASTVAVATGASVASVPARGVFPAALSQLQGFCCQ